MNVERALIELAIAEDKLAQAALRFAAAHLDAATEEGTERMLAARDALFEAARMVAQAEEEWFEVAEPLEGETDV